MAIRGIEGLSFEDLNLELQNGAKFLRFEYCISVLILTFKRSSSVYFVRAEESGFSKGLPYVILSLVLGWWGFPWGPIYTIGSLITNFRGGKDVTNEIVASFIAAGATELTGLGPSVFPQCQTENQAGDSFCIGCGTRL